jgi:hypothetical protein
MHDFLDEECDFNDIVEYFTIWSPGKVPFTQKDADIFTNALHSKQRTEQEFLLNYIRFATSTITGLIGLIFLFLCLTFGDSFGKITLGAIIAICGTVISGSIGVYITWLRKINLDASVNKAKKDITLDRLTNYYNKLKQTEISSSNLKLIQLLLPSFIEASKPYDVEDEMAIILSVFNQLKISIHCDKKIPDNLR